jgi:hypothetical protein
LDQARKPCDGSIDTLLAAGVHTIVVPLVHGNGVWLEPEDIHWPVIVRHLLVKTREEDRESMPIWSDVRYADSLAMITNRP